MKYIAQIYIVNSPWVELGMGKFLFISLTYYTWLEDYLRYSGQLRTQVHLGVV